MQPSECRKTLVDRTAGKVETPSRRKIIVVDDAPAHPPAADPGVKGLPVPDLTTQPSRTPSGYPEGNLKDTYGRMYRVASTGRITRLTPKPPSKKERRRARLMERHHIEQQLDRFSEQERMEVACCEEN